MSNIDKISIYKIYSINGKKQKDSFSVITADFNLNDLGYDDKKLSLRKKEGK